MELRDAVLLAVAEYVVPVVGGRAQAADGGVDRDHAGGCGVSGLVRVETAVEYVTAGDQCAKPGRIGADARGGDTDPLRVDLETTDGINGRFAEDDFPQA